MLLWNFVTGRGGDQAGSANRAASCPPLLSRGVSATPLAAALTLTSSTLRAGERVEVLSAHGPAGEKGFGDALDALPHAAVQHMRVIRRNRASRPSQQASRSPSARHAHEATIKSQYTDERGQCRGWGEGAGRGEGARYPRTPQCLCDLYGLSLLAPTAPFATLGLTRQSWKPSVSIAFSIVSRERS